MFRNRRRHALAVGTFLASSSAAAAQQFDVSAGRLGDVAARLGAQARATVTVTDPEIAARHSDGARGRMTLREALARALRGTGAEAVFFDATTVGITRSRARPPAVRPARRAPVAPPPPPPRSTDDPGPDIVVTASKQDLALSRYPGSARVVDLQGGWAARNGADGLAALTRLAPMVQATDLGQGRDKFFIRGVADSSFRGQTQAANGQYLGDVRLTYNAPDPSLNLYDMERVEILVGPQAPLYGSGSLGGIIRLVPHAPDVDAAAASVASNVGVTRHGGVSGDGALMVNLPVVAGRAAVRFVAFGARRAGYIDAPQQGREDINEAQSDGYRVAVRLHDVAGWTLDIGDVRENLRSEDGQYILRTSRTLARDAPIPQPFGSTYSLRYVSASRTAGSTRIVSSTALVRHRLDTVFDAGTLLGPGSRYRERNAIHIWSHETRVSGGSATAPWLIGISGIRNASRVTAAFATTDGTAEAGSLNRNVDAALFGQASRSIARDVTFLGGARLGYSNNSGIATPAVQPATRYSREALRVTTTAALNWTPPMQLSGFLRLDQGYRAGGLAVFPTDTGAVVTRYRPDTIDMYELGLRWGAETRDRLFVRASVFLADWANVQADVASPIGFTFTANVGRGVIAGIDGELAWRLHPGVTVKADGFLNHSRLHPEGDAVPLTGRRQLPNVPGSGARVAIEGARTVGVDRTLRADLSLRYVGRSWLGAGLALDIPQGDYLAADAGASIDLGRFTLSARVDNLTDTRGNTYAFGNPFTVLRQDQITPLRPRTIRLGLDARF